MILPSSTTEIEPVSSETTRTIASETWESPIAARCRVPSRSVPRIRSSGIGSRQPAATITLPRTITAPSWSGELGKKIVCRNSAVSSPLIRTPVVA